MSIWTPWRRRHREGTDERLDAAEERSDEIAASSASAITALDAALEREREQKRLNNLGWLAHEALTIPGRPKHP